jgi:hypothetical protein
MGTLWLAGGGLVALLIVVALSISLYASTAKRVDAALAETQKAVNVTEQGSQGRSDTGVQGESGTGTKGGTGNAPGQLSALETEKLVQAEVAAQIKGEELLLDKLLLIVGLYTTILSFLAVATAIVSRQDAKEQLARVEALAVSSKTQLGEIQANAEKDVAELKLQVRSQFPFISELQEKVVTLIQKLEAKYPEDENLNRPQADSWKLAHQHQDVLMDELQIVAVSVVILDTASLLKLYMVLSRSYFDRFRTGTREDSDAARAYLYASRAIECSADYADAYRMRGVSALSRYRTASKARQQTDEFKALLLQVKADLMQCRKLDPHNAGAAYNLALVYSIEDNPGEAVRISEELLSEGSEKAVPRAGQEKYFPDTYINLACYFADEAGSVTDPKVQEQLWDRAVKTCEVAFDYLTNRLKSTRGMSIFKASLRRELGASGDFAAIPADKRMILEKMC